MIRDRRTFHRPARRGMLAALLRIVAAAVAGAVIGTFVVSLYLEVIWPDAREGGMVVIFAGPPAGLAAGVFVASWPRPAGRIGAVLAFLAAGLAVSFATIGSEDIMPATLASVAALLPGAMLADRVARRPQRTRGGGSDAQTRSGGE